MGVARVLITIPRALSFPVVARTGASEVGGNSSLGVAAQEGTPILCTRYPYKQIITCRKSVMVSRAYQEVMRLNAITKLMSEQ